MITSLCQSIVQLLDSMQPFARKHMACVNLQLQVLTAAKVVLPDTKQQSAAAGTLHSCVPGPRQHAGPPAEPYPPPLQAMQPPKPTSHHKQGADSTSGMSTQTWSLLHEAIPQHGVGACIAAKSSAVWALLARPLQD